MENYNYDKNDNAIKTINVPISYGPMEKMHQIRKEIENEKKYYLFVPKLALTLNDISYDSNRVIGANEDRYFYDSANYGLLDLTEYKSDLQPTPYDFTFNLGIRTESMDHFSQITENILPYFNPSLYLRVKEFSFLNIERDLKVTLEGFNLEHSEQQTENEMRIINGNASLIVKGFMYKPTENVKLIKTIQSTFNNDEITSISGADVDIDKDNSYNVSTYSINISGDISGSPF